MIDRDLKNRGKNLKGEEQPNSILTDEAVKEIIRLYNTGLFLQREIAEKYGVSTRTISSVTNGERWKHILV
jgi:DNA-binding transcriptional regulator LsrR (DeoR family)